MVGVYAAKAYRPTISIIARCVIPEAFHLECRPYEWAYTFRVVIAYRLRHVILECTVTVWRLLWAKSADRAAASEGDGKVRIDAYEITDNTFVRLYSSLAE